MLEVSFYILALIYWELIAFYKMAGVYAYMNGYIKEKNTNLAVGNFLYLTTVGQIIIS